MRNFMITIASTSKENILTFERHIIQNDTFPSQSYITNVVNRGGPEQDKGEVISIVELSDQDVADYEARS
ncbi:hypothetical protein [Dyadobacter sp. Leaf189]|uniref:hypothetical protein n=1 Tax=Dyadobacter sp. Leaf189 TaxID=1736295 RepID=UPI000700C526|nr:hypothetical protein [Dyadobacter sp. Leaf189]KQS27005.1 hypothetical protein ASG33_20935 [Dyadobacter sp. Leaf189]